MRIISINNTIHNNKTSFKNLYSQFDKPKDEEVQNKSCPSTYRNVAIPFLAGLILALVAPKIVHIGERFEEKLAETLKY